MAINSIDPIDVKMAIKSGQLKVFVKYNSFDNNYRVYLKDNGTEDTVLLIDFREDKIKEL